MKSVTSLLLVLLAMTGCAAEAASVEGDAPPALSDDGVDLENAPAGGCSMVEIRALQAECRNQLCGGAGSNGIHSCELRSWTHGGDYGYHWHHEVSGACACRDGFSPMATAIASRDPS